MDGAPHWLVRVAQGAGLPGAESLALTPELPVADAWTEVAERCKVDQDTLDATVAKSFRLGVADLSTAESTATSVLPASVARQFAVFPLREQHRFLVVATSDPTNAVAEQEIGFASGRTPKLQIAPPDLIRELIDATYAPDRAVETLLQRIDVAGEAPVELVEDQEPEPIILVKEEFGTGPIVRLTNMILQDAVERGASDIHIQPLPTGGVVRLRIDGVLRTGVKVPLSVLARVVSRIKVMSRLDIADRLRPQDGRSRISVGEIRDRDTAEMAAQASLTGHLVLATIHANDAVGSVRRFLDLGLDPGTISNTLRGSLAQRLVRTVCPDCAERVEGQPNAEEAALARYFKVQPVVRAVGCEGCGQSGYRGRKPVVELIAPSSDFLRLVASEASHVDLTMRVRKDGMVTMLEAALELVWGGLTTLEEVERVVGEEDVMTSFMTAATPAAADLESAPASLPPRAPAPPQPVPPPAGPPGPVRGRGAGRAACPGRGR